MDVDFEGNCPISVDVVSPLWLRLVGRAMRAGKRLFLGGSCQPVLGVS